MWRYYYWQWRYSTEDYPKTLSIKFLKKYWYLESWIDRKVWNLCWSIWWRDNGNIGLEVNKWKINGSIRVYFSTTNNEWEKTYQDYKIELVSTPCNYWGVRWWFLCPCKWDRCSILYLQNNWVFASRKTLNLCYDDQKKSKRYRYMWYLMWDAFVKIELIRRTMKYPMRNWRYTKKAQRIFKLHEQMPTEDEVRNISSLLWWK